MLKATSLVSVIAGGDLLTNAQSIYARNFLILELLIVVSVWYLALTTLATLGQRLLERRFARGNDRLASVRAHERRTRRGAVE